MKIKIHDNVPAYGGKIFEVEIINGAYVTVELKPYLFFGLHEADVVEGVEKSCDDCRIPFDSESITCNKCKYNGGNFDNVVNGDTPESPTITAFRQIMEDKIKLAIAKNADYGNSFDKILDTWTDNGNDPYLSMYIRLADKFHRFENLVMGNKQQVKDESVMDTLADLSNYVDLFRGWRLRRDADNG